MGWMIREAAQQLGIDPGTWSRWENFGISWGRHQAMVEAFLEALSGT
jgi:hypothetical protein